MAVGEEQHYGRAARRLRVAQPALSRQIQDLEEELGFKLFERLPRGVKLSAAGKLFLEDARRILQEVSEAAVRAGRVASGRSGTLRVGFTEIASWRGVVPESFRRFRELQPDAELQLQPSASLEQLEAIRSGRLDAGFVNFMPKSDPELDQLLVAIQHVELAAPKRHPLTKLKRFRLRDLTDAPLSGFQGGQVPVLRPPDARMLSWRFEVSPYRSGGTERGNHPKSRSDRVGRGMGPWNGTMAVP
jgi:DNA-binding transcriptional LysR family regulator